MSALLDALKDYAVSKGFLSLIETDNEEKIRLELEHDCAVIACMYMDSAEFEARVAQKLLTLDCEDVPCGHGMTVFCPNPPFKNKDCGAWCLLREARLQVEKEMEENQ